jgi:hypothetical protein
MLPKTPTGTQEAQRIILNANIVGDTSGSWDAVADCGSDPTIGVASGNTNTTYYNADANHLNSVGMAIAAPYFANAILRVIAPATASARNYLSSVIDTSDASHVRAGDGTFLATSGFAKAIVRASGTLSSGTATVTVTSGAHPWVQDTGSSITNVGALQVSVSGTTATVQSTNVLDASPFDLFYVTP